MMRKEKIRIKFFLDDIKQLYNETKLLETKRDCG